MRHFLIIFALVFGLNAAQAQSIETSAGTVQVNKILAGLNEPWGLAFLPEGGFLVTERGGRLIHVDGQGVAVALDGVPKVLNEGQGGLLDVAVAREFSRNRQVFISFAKRQGFGSGTALLGAKLSENGRALENPTIIFEMIRGSSGGRHFGGRIVEAQDGALFLTIGERGDRPSAQDLGNHNGTVVRIDRYSSMLNDNPFADTAGARSEIWSYGHRNPQGAALDLSGQLWVSEHGAQGGDEINRVVRGANYGWPVIAYGRHYSGAKIGEGTAKAGMEQPMHYWDPSIAPSGLMIYSGKLWPQWRGDFFVGSLKFDYISRLDPDSGWREEKISSNRTDRVRDIREAPDGSIWFLSVGQGAVFRMSPG